MHTCTFASIRTHAASTCASICDVRHSRTRMHTCTHARMHTYTHAPTCASTHAHPQRIANEFCGVKVVNGMLRVCNVLITRQSRSPCNCSSQIVRSRTIRKLSRSLPRLKNSLSCSSSQSGKVLRRCRSEISRSRPAWRLDWHAYAVAMP